MSAATIEQQLRNLEKGYMELRAENQRLREALRMMKPYAERYASADEIAQVREALAGNTEEKLPPPSAEHVHVDYAGRTSKQPTTTGEALAGDAE